MSIPNDIKEFVTNFEQLPSNTEIYGSSWPVFCVSSSTNFQLESHLKWSPTKRETSDTRSRICQWAVWRCSYGVRMAFSHDIPRSYLRIWSNQYTNVELQIFSVYRCRPEFPIIWDMIRVVSYDHSIHTRAYMALLYGLQWHTKAHTASLKNFNFNLNNQKERGKFLFIDKSSLLVSSKESDAVLFSFFRKAI